MAVRFLSGLDVQHLDSQFRSEESKKWKYDKTPTKKQKANRRLNEYKGQYQDRKKALDGLSSATTYRVVPMTKSWLVHRQRQIHRA